MAAAPEESGSDQGKRARLGNRSGRHLEGPGVIPRHSLQGPCKRGLAIRERRGPGAEQELGGKEGQGRGVGPEECAGSVTGVALQDEVRGYGPSSAVARHGEGVADGGDCGAVRHELGVRHVMLYEFLLRRAVKFHNCDLMMAEPGSGMSSVGSCSRFLALRRTCT
jgi:hypothetical protein